MEKNIEINSIAEQFAAAEKRLMSLITDPKGTRYKIEKSKETRLAEYREQLARTKSFLASVGNPEEQIPAIHISGTSGKGSVTTILASLLSAHDKRVSYHVSPYLQLSLEKLVADQQIISPSEFITLVDELMVALEIWGKESQTYDILKYGEAWVSITYMWMAQQNLDWLVMETGLGGRYDPTNVIKSNIAIITNVSFDHVKSLGPSLAEIAFHKVGIIKQDGLVVSAEKNPSVIEIIEEEAKHKNAKLFLLNRDFDFNVVHNNQKATLTVNGKYNRYDNITMEQTAGYQYENIALSIASLDILNNYYPINLNTNQIQAGITNWKFKGRFEIIQNDPLVIMDGAHNRHKMAALVKSFKKKYPGKKIKCIMGVLSTKDAVGMIEELTPIVKSWSVTQPFVFGKPSTTPTELASSVLKSSPKAVLDQYDTVHDAIGSVLASSDKDEIILITGSIYLLGEASDFWHHRNDLLHDLIRKELGIS
jgi:dihydrofolate synthase / folylpolyglutamate synthase